MTPKSQNFQQGWLDVIKRNGLAAGIAVYLILFQGGRLTGQLDRIEVGVQAHEAEASKARLTLSQSADVQEKLMREQVQLQRETVDLLRALKRQNCLILADGDKKQVAECAR